MHPLLAFALLLQAPAADTMQVREGLYLGFALGPATVGLSCDECGSGTGTDFTLHGNAGLGVVLSSHLTVGVQFEAWKYPESANGVRASSLVMTWYPDGAKGAFIRPTLGIASFRGDEITDGPVEEGSGPIVGLTLGNDLRIDRKLSFTPTLTIRYADIGATTQAGLPYRGDLSAWMAGLGFGLTWH